jgi:hypothetical protein
MYRLDGEDEVPAPDSPGLYDDDDRDLLFRASLQRRIAICDAIKMFLLRLHSDLVRRL